MKIDSETSTDLLQKPHDKSYSGEAISQ
ncbi:uncharacterized protein METZ01_LOCUS172722 [marine metagenome]|uniref:Uncharacterized protein n=1 Tax=marine metagenome TaxID=408172 RepID=A0A382C1D2_9ZZZZ